MSDNEQTQNRTLYLLNNEIARIRGRHDMLQLIRNSLKLYINFDDSFILRYNKSTNIYQSYIFHAEKGRTESPVFKSQLDIKYPVGDDAMGENDFPVVQDVDLLVSTGHSQLSFIQGTGIKEFVSVKLVERNELLGLFVLLSEKRNSFTQKGLDLLNKISYPISIATANIIANEEIVKRDEEKTVLLSLSTEIAALKSREDLFQVVNTKLKKLLALEEFGIAQIDEGGKTYSAFILEFTDETKKVSNFNSVTSAKYSTTDPIFTRVMVSEEPVLFDVNEVVELPGMPAYVHFWKKAGFKYYLTVPLRVGGVNIGFVNFHFEDKEAVDARRVLLKGICSQLAVAVSNIRATEKNKEREDEKNLLISLSNEIAALKTRADLFKVVNGKIKQLFSIKELGFSKIDDTGETYSIFLVDVGEQVSSHPDFGTILTARFDVHDPLFMEVMNSEDPILYEVDELVKRPNMPEYVFFWKITGIWQVVTYPLRVGGIGIGTALFIIEKDNVFNLNSTLFKGVCSQLAVAVFNVLANEKILARESEKTRLLEFSNAMASVVDRQTLGKILKDQLSDLFGIGDYVIHVLSNDKKTHRPVLFDHEADFAQHPDFQKLIHADTDVNDGVFNTILASDELVAFNVEDWFNSSNPPAYSDAAKAINLKRMAGISIRLGKENIAVMNFRKDGLSAFTFQKPLFKSICSQLAITVSNIMANDEIRRREEEKSMLLEFSNAIASVRDKYTFAKILKQQLTKLFSIEDYVINILSEDQQFVIRFLYDVENEIFRKPEFLRLLEVPIDVNDGVFNKILASEVPVTFKVEDWARMKKPPVYLEAARATGLKNLTGMRLLLGGKSIAFISLKHDDFGLLPFQLPFLKSICSQITIAVSNILANEKVNEQLIEIGQYKEQLEEEKIYLKEEIETTHNYSEIVGESPEIKKVFRMVTQVSPADSTVLLLGETGTGKELIARAIHNASPRKNKLMIKINCAALPANLIESELFGHERGSFTGAIDKRIGKFELANNGTLFLDEIGEMPLELQVKLLRALQEKEIERIGGKITIKTDVRIIAATNRDLEKLMEEGKFRTDLFYRLNIFPIQLPPLRKRREDIPQLASYFVTRFSKKAGKKISNFSNKALDQLKSYDWPGNIRELEHFIERSVLLTNGDTIKEIHLPDQKAKAESKLEPERFKVQTIFENEKEYILKILTLVDGRISGEGGAAEILGVPPSTLNSRIRKLGIRKEHRG